jgi:predicted transcriptional regulator
VGNRRHEMEILMNILRITMREARVTHIMYRANLSYSSLRRYLSEALNMGLIVKEYNGDGLPIYRITEKGRSLLEKLEEVEKFMQS